MLLNEHGKVTYLANILLVALSDKSMSAEEANVLEKIRKNIDAKKGVLISAQKAVANGSYSFVKAGSFADQVRNLEDMLLVSLVDKDLDGVKSQMISEFSRLISVNQSQFDQITEETLRYYDSTEKEVICLSCLKPTQAIASFCPSCGHPLSLVSAETKIDLSIPKTGWAIEFCESTAGGFTTALELAKATGTLQSATKNKKTWHLVTALTDNFSELIPIASSLSGIRNRKVYLDGQELIWGEVFGFTWCAAQRLTAYRPNEYCFGKEDNRINPWGCKHAGMEWSDWAPWLSYGHWQQEGFINSKYLFVFDKSRIKHEITTNLYRYRFCPHMRTQLAEAVLKNLPEKVEITSTGPWKYSRAYECLPGSIKIIERDGGYTNEYYTDGVRPRGFSALIDILGKAFYECRINGVAVINFISKA